MLRDLDWQWATPDGNVANSPTIVFFQHEANSAKSQSPIVSGKPKFSQKNQLIAVNDEIDQELMVPKHYKKNIEIFSKKT